MKGGTSDDKDNGEWQFSMPAASLWSLSQLANADPGRLGFASRGVDAPLTLQNAQAFNLYPCPKTEGVQFSTGRWQGYDTQGPGRSRQPSLHLPTPSPLPPPPPLTLRSSDLSAAEPAATRTCLKAISLHVMQVTCPFLTCCTFQKINASCSFFFLFFFPFEAIKVSSVC